MPSYKNKYITLKDASIISGYTVLELRNFVKIGLVPFRRVKNRVYIRFDAFEKLNNTRASGKGSTGAKAANAAKAGLKTKNKISMNTNLIPFVQPSRTLVKFLEPVSFAAALIMVVYLVALPGVSEGVAFGIGVTEATIDYMADSTADMMALSLELPVAVAQSQFSPAVSDIADADQNGRVAGAVMGAGGEPAYPNSADRIGDNLTGALIAVADASDSFQRLVQEVGDTGFDFIISNLRFDKLDPLVQQTFQW